MKQLLTSLLLGLSVLASAQSDGFQYPFPYNPDGNSDGYISLNDMLDLLSVYGQEYPQSFATDTSRAVLYLGRMGSYKCLLQAEAAGKEWRMMQDTDIPYFLGMMVEVIPAEQTNSAWCWDTNDNRPDLLSIYYAGGPENAGPNEDWVITSDSATAYSVSWEGDGSDNINLTYKALCLIVSEVRPEYEFSLCYSTSDASFSQCVTEKLNDGWIPMPGGNRNSPSGFYQGFWRIVED